jgi:hypothetical protein
MITCLLPSSLLLHRLVEQLLGQSLPELVILDRDLDRFKSSARLAGK